MRSAVGGQAIKPADSIRRDLIALRRLFQRRELGTLWSMAYGDAEPLDYAELRLLDAMQACRSLGGPDGVTVGAIAIALGVDPSRSSRMVADAVGKGLLSRAAAQSDGRKVVLVETDAGAALLAKGGKVTESRIADALSGFSPAQQQDFARLLSKFVSRVTDVEPRA